jgi:nucleotide-binding universal stress UspA family protein
MKTQKIVKVLIALDYDPTAQKVADAGFSIAKKLDTEITLLHVILDPLKYSSADYSPIMGFTGYADMGPIETDSVDELKNAARKYLDKAKHHLGDESIKTLIREGNIADSILEASKTIHADMIVIGSYSRKLLDKMVMGSVTEKVLQLTTVPLLIIPTGQGK